MLVLLTHRGGHRLSAASTVNMQYVSQKLRVYLTIMDLIACKKNTFIHNKSTASED